MRVKKANGTRMPTRIAPWVGVDADEREPARFDPGLLHQLAPAGILDRLANVHETARQRTLAGVRRVLAANEQEPPLPVDGDAVYG